MFAFVKALISPVTAIAGPIIDGWQKRKSAELEADLRVTEALTAAKISHAETAQAGEINWDAMAMKNSAGSWKDEFWTIVFAIPVILCFIPGMAPVVLSGFQVLSATPVWFQGLFGVLVAASVGYRKAADWIYNLK